MFIDSNYEDDSLVKNKSTFHPHKGRNKNLDTFFEKISNIDLKENTKIKNNLPPKWREALKEIQNNEKIIIKEADKGSAVVIMDKEYYQNKIKTMLNDHSNYRPIEKNIDKDILSKINKLCTKYEKH